MARRDTVESLALATAPRPRLVVLTGAGISVDCGLRPYRGPGGLLHEVPATAAFVTAGGLAGDRPAALAHFTDWRRQVLAAAPGPAHRALSRLGRLLGPRMTLVTQNVDFLHERAGSTRVLAMHGDLARVRCEAARPHDLPWPEAGLEAGSRCPIRGLLGGPCGAPLRPRVVLFGEAILHGRAIERALDRCTAFWAIGTSGVVAPAATFVLRARLAGAVTASFDLAEPGAEARDELASLAAAAYGWVVIGRADETVPAACEALAAACGLGRS